MKLNKKIILGLSIIGVAVIGLFAINYFSPKENIGDKTITIIVQNEMVDPIIIIYEDEYRTDATTLADLLSEAEDLQVVTEDSSFGLFITSIRNLEQGDISVGPWWLYESENNPTCTQAGYCPGITEVMLQDADIFVFKYTNTY